MLADAVPHWLTLNCSRVQKVLRLVSPADLIPSIFENCFEKRRCGVLCQWEVCSMTFQDVERELLLFATWATNVLLHISPSWMLCRTSPCCGRAYYRTMGIATGSVPLRVTHTGAVESITGTSVTITRIWLKEGVRDVGCCGRIASRDNLHYSGTRELSSAQCRWREPLFQSTSACSHLAIGTGVHRVRQRSDVDLVEKSACVESGRQHFSHVAEGRDCECRKG